MISPHEAGTRILAALTPLPPETTPLANALGRYVHEPVLAVRSLPGFDFSAMDGYAIHAADCESTPSLTVIGTHAAGAPAHLEVRPGQAVRIFTGAPIPTGTGAVVMQEGVDVTSEAPRILIREPAAVGEFIRRQGTDVCAGQILLNAGERCTAGHVGILTAQGLSHLRVGSRPHVAILTTGSELLAPGQAAEHDAQIFDSNGPMLRALLLQHQVATDITLAHAADDLQAITQCMERLLEQSSVLICVGGVSVGDHDLVKPALAKLGVATDFWRVAMKPGKPFLFGQHEGKAIFGLPGNPVSAYVTAFLLVLPALRKMAGAGQPETGSVLTKLAVALQNKDQRLTYFRGRWDSAAGTFTPLGLQESHALFGLSLANALLPIPPETTLEAGTTVSILPLD